MKKNRPLTIAEQVELLRREQQIKENLDLNKEEKVVIHEKNKISIVLSFLSNLVLRLFKIIIVILIMILSTIGATVLLNSELRNIFFELINLNLF